MFVFSGSGCGKPCQHQLSDCSQVRSFHPQGELLLPHTSGPQQGSLSGLFVFLGNTSAHLKNYIHRLLTAILSAFQFSVWDNYKTVFLSFFYGGPVGGDALWHSCHPSEERDHLGQSFIHPVPRCAPLHGQHVWQRSGLLWSSEGWCLAQRRVHRCELKIYCFLLVETLVIF